MSDTLAVNEVFGPTFQGEGVNIGMPCYFLRLAGCNLSCKFCDTPYTWDWTGKNGKAYDPKDESHAVDIQWVLQKLILLDVDGKQKQKIKNLVVSGGEPMLQQKNLSKLIGQLKEIGWWVEIETAGTIAPIAEMNPDLFTVSLKLANSGNEFAKCHIASAIEAFAQDERSAFKFVVSNLGDFFEIDALVNTYQLPQNKIYIMPEGITIDSVQEHAQAVAFEVIKRGWKLTTRMQILLYGNQRGV